MEFPFCATAYGRIAFIVLPHDIFDKIQTNLFVICLHSFHTFCIPPVRVELLQSESDTDEQKREGKKRIHHKMNINLNIFDTAKFLSAILCCFSYSRSQLFVEVCFIRSIFRSLHTIGISFT